MRFREQKDSLSLHDVESLRLGSCAKLPFNFLFPYNVSTRSTTARLRGPATIACEPGAYILTCYDFDHLNIFNAPTEIPDLGPGTLMRPHL